MFWNVSNESILKTVKQVGLSAVIAIARSQLFENAHSKRTPQYVSCIFILILV